jgi:UDP-glucose:tetrahydrobiopterin glucosyltransferase
LNLLFVSTPVGPLGSGRGGGVELTLANIAQVLGQRGHQITVLAPQGSRLEGVCVHEVAGQVQTTAQTQGRSSAVVLPENSVLANMWALAHMWQAQYDLIVNFAYDWLPFYLTPLFKKPIGHVVSMGSLTQVMDQAIAAVAASHPHTIAMHSRAQAASFEPPIAQVTYLLNGFDLSHYPICAVPDNFYAWVGRIAPEKGLEDAFAATQACGVALKVWGVVQDPAYWQEVQAQYPQAQLAYQGFVSTAQLGSALAHAKALLMTPKWVEAFGNVAIEALACGVPVIAYARGGPAEIVQSGRTGYVVTPDDVGQLVHAMGQIDQIDRQHCRVHAGQHYSLSALGDRVEDWLGQILRYQVGPRTAPLGGDGCDANGRALRFPSP